MWRPCGTSGIGVPSAEVAHRGGQQDLAGLCQRGDPNSDLDLAGVEPGTHRQAELLHGVAQRYRAGDRARGAVEDAEEPVAERLDLTAAVRSEQLAHGRVVDGVGEQHRHDGGRCVWS